MRGQRAVDVHLASICVPRPYGFLKSDSGALIGTIFGVDLRIRAEHEGAAPKAPSEAEPLGLECARRLCQPETARATHWGEESELDRGRFARTSACLILASTLLVAAAPGSGS